MIDYTAIMEDTFRLLIQNFIQLGNTLMQAITENPLESITFMVVCILAGKANKVFRKYA